jgi:hypothetical protein
MTKQEAKHLAVAVTVLTLAVWGIAAGGQEYEQGNSPPAARATQRAADRAERRAGMDVVARETIRAGRREEMHQVEQAVEIRNPVPLPVEIRNPGGLVAAGKPAAGACPTNESCKLAATPNVREVLVVTAIWSATRVECDGVVASSPSNGAPIAPWWRCQQRFTVEGPGAGYTGFMIVQ